MNLDMLQDESRASGPGMVNTHVPSPEQERTGFKAFQCSDRKLKNWQSVIALPMALKRHDPSISICLMSKPNSFFKASSNVFSS